MLTLALILSVAAPAAAAEDPVLQPCVFEVDGGFKEPSSERDLDSCQKKKMREFLYQYTRAWGHEPRRSELRAARDLQEREMRAYRKRNADPAYRAKKAKARPRFFKNRTRLEEVHTDVPEELDADMRGIIENGDVEKKAAKKKSWFKRGEKRPANPDTEGFSDTMSEFVSNADSETAHE